MCLHQGQRTDKTLRGKIPEVAPGKRTREIAAEKAGFGNDKTYRQAAKVVLNGTPKLIQAMDDGRVSISAASILSDADSEEQEAIVELDEKAIVLAARKGELDPNTPLSSDDPALAEVLAGHVKTVFADYGGKLGMDD